MPLKQIDKKRLVDECDGRLWADARGFPYFEVSALNGTGISEMFQVCDFRVPVQCDSIVSAVARSHTCVVGK